MSKKILIISPYYYPNINPRPYRWTKIAEHWAKQGHQVFVVTEKHHDFSKKQILNGVTVHRVGYAALKSMIPSQRRGEISNDLTKRKNTFGTFVKSKAALFFQFVNDSFWKKIYFPDDSALWFRSALHCANKIIQQEKIEVMVSVALPFTSHLVGLKLKQQNPHIQWIADCGDPFSFQFEAPLNNPYLYKNINIIAEKKVLRLADSISVTTERTKQRYIDFEPQIAHKINVIPPLLSDNATEMELIKPLNLDKTKIHFGYFGKFYKVLREPTALLRFIDSIRNADSATLDKFQFHIFGDVFPVFQSVIKKEPTIIYHGLIAREQVFATMQQMKVLLNIGNTTDYQLPSKAPDYLQSKQHILNLYHNDNDEFKAFFGDYPLIYNQKISNDIDIDALLHFLKTMPSIIDIEQLIEPYRITSIAAQYLES